MTRLFLDTSIVIYSLDPRDGDKQRKALAWLSAAAKADSLTISPQVCTEARSVAVRKLKLSVEFARDAVLRLLPWCTAPMTADEVRRAFALVERWRLSWWDALLLASAIGAECTHFLTEDAQSAPVIGGVKIIDPFVAAPEEVLGATQG